MLFLCMLLAVIAWAQAVDPKEQAAQLRTLVSQSPSMILERAELQVRPPSADWAMEMVSSVTSDSKGVIYLLQRGAKANPVIAVDRNGAVLRSWGKGLYKIPHSIRVDPDGNVWTVDAGSSMVYQFTPAGKKLLEIAVGEMPGEREFRGTADIAFGPDGRILIADGYGNARILEYNRAGKRVREWGTRGSGPGQFNLPHGIAIDEKGTVFVADRENGRIQRFTIDGKYLGEWGSFGKTFSLTLRGDALYIGTQPRNEPNGSPGWLMKIDKSSGKILGVVESTGHHSIEALPNGELLTGTRPDKVLWFRSPR
jgi:DNA-binding beta-propeller fold protein YncE